MVECMKKLLLVLLSVMLMVGLSACGEDSKKAEAPLSENEQFRKDYSKCYDSVFNLYMVNAEYKALVNEILLKDLTYDKRVQIKSESEPLLDKINSNIEKSQINMDKVMTYFNQNKNNLSSEEVEAIKALLSYYEYVGKSIYIVSEDGKIEGERSIEECIEFASLALDKQKEVMDFNYKIINKEIFKD